MRSHAGAWERAHSDSENGPSEQDFALGSMESLGGLTLELKQLAPKLADDLLQAAQIGHKRSVVSAIDTIEQDGGLSGVALSQLRVLAHAMRLDQIERLLTETVNHV